MLQHKKIRIGKNNIEALLLNLSSKNLIVLRGRKGYIMCGYLNLKAAEKFNDAAVKITGVSTIEGALRARVRSVTKEAGRLGIHKGQAVREVLKIIA